MRPKAVGAGCGLERGTGENGIGVASGRVRGVGVLSVAVAAGVAAAEILDEDRGVDGGSRIGGSLCHQRLEAVASARMTCLRSRLIMGENEGGTTLKFNLL